jgi:hypothetical protein
MLQTRRHNLRRATTLKQKSPLLGFQYTSYGPDKSIRTNDVLGIHLVKNQTVDIDGCDWRGALSIYYNLSPRHKSISDDEIFYFMLPEVDSGPKIDTNENTVFLAVFHDLHNRCMLLDPWSCPPFRTAVDTKYTYIKQMLIDISTETEFAGLNSAKLDDLIKDVQRAVGIKPFNSWLHFRSMFVAPRFSEPIPVVMTHRQLLDTLEKYIKNGPAVVDFLNSPIDSDDINATVDPIQPCDITDKICRLMLEKLEHHSIFQQTNVLPIGINWIQRLDLIINPVNRDGF